MFGLRLGSQGLVERGADAVPLALDGFQLGDGIIVVLLRRPQVVLSLLAGRVVC